MVLSTTFPKRQFTADDMNSTFTELQLAPTASVIALPAVSFVFVTYTISKIKETSLIIIVIIYS